MKSFLHVSLIIMMVAAVFAGCSTSTKDNSASQSSNPVQSQTNNEPGEQENADNSPITITAVRHINGDVKFKNGEDMENNVISKLIEEKTGVKIHYLWTTTGAEDVFVNKLILGLTANQQMPDVFSFQGGQLNGLYPLLESGKYRDDIGELFDKYASPKWKAAMEQAPDAWNPYTINGKKVGIPILDSQMNSDEVLYVREDWLKKLNLKAPTTIDEMETVLDAFVNGDPDGDNKKDTYGLAVGFKNQLHTWMSDSGFIFGAYGDMPDIWNKGQDGTLSYGSVQPTIKEGLAKMRDWMSKGYLHPESGVWDEVKATELWNAGKVGMIVAPRWAPAWPLNDVTKNVAGAEYKPYPIPKGPTGLSATRSTPSQYGAIVISKDLKNPEAVFKYMNFVYDNFVNPESGSDYQWGLAEGYDYAMKDGKPTYQDNEIPGGYVDVQKYLLCFDIPNIPNLMITTMDKLNRGEKPVTPYEIKASLSPIKQVLEASSIVLQNKDIAKPSMFTGSPTPTMKSKGSNLETMLKETFQKIIYGKAPIDEFDKAVAKWKSSGGDDITKEVNAWYKSVSQGQ